MRESVVERGVTHEAVFAPAQAEQNDNMTFSVANPLHQRRAAAPDDTFSLDMPEGALPSTGPVESMEIDAVQIRKFDKRIRRSFIIKFHYWETRDRGYHRKDALDRFDLQRFKQLHGIAEAGGEAEAVNRGVSVTQAAMKMSKMVDLSASKAKRPIP